jgi:hypothetical protein
MAIPFSSALEYDRSVPGEIGDGGLFHANG